MNVEQLQQTTKFNGNLLVFYAFDFGDEVDLEKIKQKNILQIKTPILSAYFKNYHKPLFFTLDENDSVCISAKLHHFGVVSFCYKIPFQNSFDELKRKVIDVKDEFDVKSKADAKKVFDKILPYIKKSRFYNLDNFYYAVQFDTLNNQVTPEAFKDIYGSKIASLLRLETLRLSEYQEGEILSSTTGYSGQDMVIIDSEASFIYDNEYFDYLEFFEFACIQQLELQSFDRLLDEKLTFFYTQPTYKMSWKAYVPLIGERLKYPVSQLSTLKVDISVITERLENSIKMVGDAYYTRFYSMLTEQLSLKEWRDSINRKLDIIKDIYNFYQDRLDVIHEGILELIVIILIATEIVLAIIR